MCTARPGIQKSRKRVQAGEKHFQAFLPGKIYPIVQQPQINKQQLIKTVKITVTKGDHQQRLDHSKGLLKQGKTFNDDLEAALWADVVSKNYQTCDIVPRTSVFNRDRDIETTKKFLYVTIIHLFIARTRDYSRTHSKCIYK